MPLLDRADCVLVVVDAQPAFVTHPSMSAAECKQAAAALDRATWLVGLTTLPEVPIVVVAEGPDRNGATDQTFRERLPASTPVLAKSTSALWRSQRR